MPKRLLGSPRGDQRWSTLLKSHAKAILACDLAVAVTATFRMLYIFVVIEHAMRRLVYVILTYNPTSSWALQQLREVVGEDSKHGYLIHDRDRIFSKALDDSIKALGLKVLLGPVASPPANSICERVIGTIRRECLDWVIPMSEKHLRAILARWCTHYSCARVHMVPGPGVPDPPKGSAVAAKSDACHRSGGAHLLANLVLGGLHRNYLVATAMANT